MSVAEKEARLLRAVATELQQLALLESFRLTGADVTVADVTSRPTGFTLFSDVAVSFKTPLAYNADEAHQRMSSALALLVAEGARELVDTAVARQREEVQAARDALAAFQAKPQDTPLAAEEPPPPAGNADALEGRRMDSADAGDRELEGAI